MHSTTRVTTVACRFVNLEFRQIIIIVTFIVELPFNPPPPLSHLTSIRHEVFKGPIHFRVQGDSLLFDFARCFSFTAPRGHGPSFLPSTFPSRPSLLNPGRNKKGVKNKERDQVKHLPEMLCLFTFSLHAYFVAKTAQGETEGVMEAVDG
jgi:hypothetical protein